MSLVRCENGHFYDNVKFKQCPHCGRNTKNRSDWTVPLFAKKGQRKQSISEGEMPFSSQKEEESLTLQEQIVKAYMKEGEEPISVQTFYAEKTAEEKIVTREEPEAAAEEKIVIREEPKAAAEEKIVTREEPEAAAEETVLREKPAEEPQKLSSVQGRYVAGWLVCIDGKQRGESFEVLEGDNAIGRGKDMDVDLRDDLYVSRKKQIILSYRQTEHAFFLRPGEARELAYVNDKPVLREMEMLDGDVLVIGTTKLLFKALCGVDFHWDRKKGTEG